MSEPYIGEIKLFPIHYVPRGWIPCEGQLLNISTNQALYSILGIRYGGDGRTNFKLPNLTGRVAIHYSADYPQGRSGGEAKHQLTVSELPSHTHEVKASSSEADSVTPKEKVWANGASPYAVTGTKAKMNSGAIHTAGGDSAHSNMQPFLAMRYCIAIQGVYPSRG